MQACRLGHRRNPAEGKPIGGTKKLPRNATSTVDYGGITTGQIEGESPEQLWMFTEPHTR